MASFQQIEQSKMIPNLHMTTSSVAITVCGGLILVNQINHQRLRTV